jgi:hypothetical protein
MIRHFTNTIENDIPNASLLRIGYVANTIRSNFHRVMIDIESKSLSEFDVPSIPTHFPSHGCTPTPSKV